MKINRKQLLEALTIAKSGLSKDTLIEHADKFLLFNKSIITYNDEISLSIPFELEELGELALAVPVKEFYGILEKLPDEEIEINPPEEGIPMIIKGSKGREVEIVVEDISDHLLAALIPISKLKGWKKLPEDFCNALKFCSFTAGTDITKPALTCLFVQGCYVKSSDNFRITKKKMSSKMENEMLIPKTSAMELIKSDPVEYVIEENWLHFRNKNKVVFSCRAVKGKYPNVEKHLNLEGQSVKFPKRLTEVLSRSSVFSDEGDMTKLSLSKGKLVVEGKGENGKYTEPIKIPYSGKDINIQVSAQFLSEIIPHLQEAIIGESTMLFNGDGFCHLICLSE